MTKLEAMIQLVASINQGGKVPPRLAVAVARKQLKAIYTPQLENGSSSPKINKAVQRPPALPGDDVIPPISKRVTPTNSPSRKFDIQMGFLMGFGKHTDQLVDDVLRKYPEYIRWVHENTGKSFDPEILTYMGMDAKPEADEDPNPPTDWGIPDRGDDEDVPF